MGVALVPASLVNLRRTGVVYRPLTDRSPRIELGIAWRGADDGPAVQAFVGLARAHARGARERA
jgi:DNA-binding transcriptional LysR family regulator